MATHTFPRTPIDARPWNSPVRYTHGTGHPRGTWPIGLQKRRTPSGPRFPGEGLPLPRPGRVNPGAAITHLQRLTGVRTRARNGEITAPPARPLRALAPLGGVIAR